MAAGESGRADRSGGEDPRSVRAARRRPRQVGERKVLDDRAARLAAADLLARRAWTRAELVTRLKRRGAPEGVAAAVVDDLVARGYVDDRAFALQWVQGRTARGYGPARLRIELRLRGVASALIEAALATIDGESDLAQARATARRRHPVLLRNGQARAAVRLRDYLLRRGFSSSVVVRVVREVTGQSE